MNHMLQTLCFRVSVGWWLEAVDFPGNKHKIQVNTENSDLYQYDGHIVTYIRQKYFPG